MLEKLKNMDEKRKVLFIFSILLIFIVLALFTFCAIFSITQIKDNKMKKGVHIAGINVSGLTKQRAKETIENLYNTNLNDSVFLKYKNYTYCITIEQIDARFDIDAAIDKAYNIGREGNFIQNDLKVLDLMMHPNANVEINLNYNENNLINCLKDISSKLPDQVIQSSYYIDGSDLIITSGKVGAKVDIESMSKLILEAITTASYKDTYYQILTHSEYPNPIDVDKIHSEIYKVAKDAYFTTNPRMVYAEVKGVDFEDSVEDVKKLIAKEKKDEYEIPLHITKPKVTTEDLGEEAFPNRLSSFSTNYVTSNTNRTTNLRLAAKKINGTVIMPGETFSYNKVVGERSIEAGYKEAAMYTNGEVSSGVGGGICQITSTLYNAVLFANLEIVQRQNHTLVPSYVKGGRDATVVYGSIDFKFKNNRDYPIKLRASVSGGVATISVYGLKTENDKRVEISSERIKNRGGYSTYNAYIYKYDKNGKLVEKRKLSTDTYKNY